MLLAKIGTNSKTGVSPASPPPHPHTPFHLSAIHLWPFKDISVGFLAKALTIGQDKNSLPGCAVNAPAAHSPFSGHICQGSIPRAITEADAFACVTDLATIGQSINNNSMLADFGFRACCNLFHQRHAHEPIFGPLRQKAVFQDTALVGQILAMPLHFLRASLWQHL